MQDMSWSPLLFEPFQYSSQKQVIISLIVWARQSLNAFKDRVAEWITLINCDTEFSARMMLAIKIQHNFKEMKESDLRGNEVKDQAGMVQRQGRGLFRELIDLTDE